MNRLGLDREQRLFRRPELNLVFLALIAIYGHLLPAPFLPWDDDYNITQNPYFLAGEWLGLWANAHYGMYIPATSTVWGSLWHVFDHASWPFRVLNLSLHLGNTALFAWLLAKVLSRFSIESRLAWMAGVCIFALHPLQVATVAWISGGRDLLAAFFALSSVCIFIRSPSVTSQIMATLIFSLGLLSKPQVAALPAAILIAVWLFEKHRLKRTLPLMTLWCAIGATAALVTFETQSTVVDWKTSIWQRPIIMLDSFGFYIAKTFWPHPLAVDYGRIPARIAADSGNFAWTVALFVLVALGMWAWCYRRDRKYSIGILWLVALLPVSGIVDFGFQEISNVADHYNYLALTIVGTIMAFAVADLQSRISAKLLSPAITLLAISLSGLSFARTGIWKDKELFFNDMLEKNRSSYSAMIGLGGIYCSEKSDTTAGLIIFSKALTERPFDPVAIANSAFCLFQAKRYEEVVKMKSVFQSPRFLERAKRHDVASANFLSSMGSAIFYRGNDEKAFYLLCQAFAYNSNDPVIRRNLETLHVYWATKRGSPRACPQKESLEKIGASIE